MKHFGKCALCGKECNLSFEHIPPESAFNNSPAKPVSGDKLVEDDDRMPWDTSGLKYEHQQRGMGKYSLCRDCNSFTGVYYGKADRVRSETSEVRQRSDRHCGSRW